MGKQTQRWGVANASLHEPHQRLVVSKNYKIIKPKKKIAYIIVSKHVKY